MKKDLRRRLLCSVNPAEQTFLKEMTILMKFNAKSANFGRTLSAILG